MDKDRNSDLAFSTFKVHRFSRRQIILAGAALGASAFDMRTLFAAEAAVQLAPEIKKIKDRGQLLVALTNFDSPPFFYPRVKAEDAGKPATLDGFDIQLAKDIASALEVGVVFNRQPENFNKVVDFVAGGEADIGISKLSLTAKRAAIVRFTDPSIVLRHALLANRLALARLAKGRDVQTILNRGFAGSIGVIADSSFADTARQLFLNAAIRELASWDAVVDAVNRGAVDIAYRDELEIKRIMRLRPELHLNVRSVLISDKRDSIALALPWQNTQMTAFVNVILTQRKKVDANQLLDEYADMFG